MCPHAFVFCGSYKEHLSVSLKFQIFFLCKLDSASALTLRAQLLILRVREDERLWETERNEEKLKLWWGPASFFLATCVTEHPEARSLESEHTSYTSGINIVLDGANAVSQKQGLWAKTMSHCTWTHNHTLKHTYVCTASFMRKYTDVMHYLAPNPNHLN